MTKMNINSGGKNVPHMHDTVIPLTNPFKKGGQIQKMQFDDILPDDDPNKQYQGQPKGIRFVLAERGYSWSKKVGDCKDCKKSRSRKPHLTGLTEQEKQQVEGDDGNDSEEEEAERPVDCCLHRILSLQEDFQAEKSLLEKVSEKEFAVYFFDNFTDDCGCG